MAGRNDGPRRGTIAAVLAAGLLAAPGPAAPAGDIPRRVGEQLLPCPAREDRPEDYPAATRRSVADLVHRFVKAYNEGDLLVLEETFAQEQDFRWYFVQGEREREDAEARHTLLPYFAQRHVLNDRLRLSELAISRKRGWHGGYDFFVELRRQSDEPRARGVWHGKGAADCAIFTWSVGQGRA